MRRTLELLRRTAHGLGLYLPGVLWLCASLFALLWLLMSSLKTNQEIFAGVWNLPESFYLGGYVRALKQANMVRFLINSTVLSVVVVGIVNMLAAMAAHVLTRIRFRGRRIFSLYFLAGMAIPVLMTIVPLYAWMQKLGLLDNLIGLGLVYVAISLPFSIFILTGFFVTIPHDLEEAAMIDGASDFSVFWHVTLPLARPGIVTISIFTFLGVWNEYLLALILLHSPEQTTLPLGLYLLRAQQQIAVDWTSLFAGVIIVMVPSVTIFLIPQERLRAGLMQGALKG